MHRDAHVVFHDELADFFESVLKLFLPREGAYRMGSEWDKIRGDSKKEEPMVTIKLQYLKQAIKVVLYCLL